MGAGFLTEVPICVIIIYKMTTDQALLWSTVVGYVCLLIMLMINSGIFIWMKKKINKISDSANVDAFNKI